MRLISYNCVLLTLTLSLIWVSLSNINLDGMLPITETHIWPAIYSFRPDQPSTSKSPQFPP
jgi:hypothetical protein